MRNYMIRPIFAGIAAAFAAAVLTAPAAHAAPSPHSAPAATTTTQTQQGQVIEITSVAQFHDEIQNNPRVIVMGYAAWCSPCQVIRPHYDMLAASNKRIVFLAFDAYEFPTLQAENYFEELPGFLSYHREKKNGKSFWRIQSARP